MTEKELQIERKYRYEERLGILCGTSIPTAEQSNIAREEADAAVRELRSEERESLAERLKALRESL